MFYEDLPGIGDWNCDRVFPGNLDSFHSLTSQFDDMLEGIQSAYLTSSDGRQTKPSPMSDWWKCTSLSDHDDSSLLGSLRYLFQTDKSCSAQNAAETLKTPSPCMGEGIYFSADCNGQLNGTFCWEWCRESTPSYESKEHDLFQYEHQASSVSCEHQLNYNALGWEPTCVVYSLGSRLDNGCTVGESSTKSTAVPSTQGNVVHEDTVLNVNDPSTTSANHQVDKTDQPKQGEWIVDDTHDFMSLTAKVDPRQKGPDGNGGVVNPLISGAVNKPPQVDSRIADYASPEAGMATVKPSGADRPICVNKSTGSDLVDASKLQIQDLANIHQEYYNSVQNESDVAYQDILFDHGNDDEPLWSIVTDTVTYGKVDTDSETVNVSYSYDISEEKSEQIFKVFKENNEYESHDRHCGISLAVKEKLNPEIDITTTYLYSVPNAVTRRTANSFWSRGIIPLNPNFYSIGLLAHGEAVKTLFDTGASKCMLNQQFYDNNEFMHTYPILKIKPKAVHMADNRRLMVDKCVTFLINFSGHIFEITAYILPIPDTDIDFIFGLKAMVETEGFMDFSRLTYSFMMRSIPIYSERTMQIPPLGTASITAKPRQLPEDFQHTLESGVVKMRSGRWDLLPQTLHVDIFHGEIDINTTNASRTGHLNIDRKHPIGYLDMRSFGYYDVSRPSVQRYLKNRFRYLNDISPQHFQTTFDLFARANTRIATRIPLPSDRKIPPKDPQDPYPWLDPDDPRRNMTDEEIIRSAVKLDEAFISEKEKEEAYQAMIKYREAFSLRDEIGSCPNMEVELELTDTTPFFIRPFPCTENEKAIIDKEMKKGVLLGILRRGMSSYSSPIMLIPRKNSPIPRIVTDFRHLNSRLVRLNPSIPLVRDAIQILGASECELISVIDLRDAYHTLRLSKKSQPFCGITPYYGSGTYLYTVLGMGLSCSPAIWQDFINRVLDQIKDRQHHLAIMDDCLVHSKAKDHLYHLIALFKALIRNGLKISPRKCQLFRTKLTYMGHTIIIKNKTPCITPMKTNVESVLQLKKLESPKDCKSFCGMVNFLSIYLKNLQGRLEPIYFLTRKGVPFHWGEEQQKAFDEIKRDLTNPPVLTMPNKTGKFTLVSDTSKVACGATLFQEQNGQMKLVGYFSKKLPEPAKRYSISELELTGLAVNITSMKHLLRNADFQVYVDHSALVHILNAKREPPTLRLQKLVEVLSGYSFTIKFMKGKDLHVTDFLSRHPIEEDVRSGDIIPISFTLREWRHDDKLMTMYQKIMWMEGEHICSQCFDTAHERLQHLCQKDIANAIVTRGAAKQADVAPPPMYPLTGDHKLPEKSQHGIIPAIPQVEDKADEVNEPNILDDPLQGLDDAQKDEDQIEIRSPENGLYRKPTSLLEQITKQAEIRTTIPKQAEIDKFVKILKRKILHNYELPIEIKEMKAEYPRSPYYKDIYKYLQRNICPFTGRAAATFKMLCQDYLTYDGILFRIKWDKNNGEPYMVLCIPEKYIPIILYNYHGRLLAGHQGILRMHLTLREKFDFPNMFQIIYKYVEACHECQSRRPKSNELQVHYPRIPYTFKPMKRISTDVKHMPPSAYGFQYILFCTCEVSNYVVGICIANLKSETIAEALTTRVFSIFGPPEIFILDEARYLTSGLMTKVFDSLQIKAKVISPLNHGSNKTERMIQTLNNMICKHLEGNGDKWPLFVSSCCYAMNTFVSPHLGFSPHELVFVTKPVTLFSYDIEDNPDLTTTGTHYLELMRKRKQLIENLIGERTTWGKKMQEIRCRRKITEPRTFAIGDLVYIYAPTASSLQAPSRKLKQEWIGPLQIHTILDDSHYLVSDLEGKLLPVPMHTNRLKTYKFSLDDIDEGKLVVVDNSYDLRKLLTQADKDVENTLDNETSDETQPLDKVEDANQNS